MDLLANILGKIITGISLISLLVYDPLQGSDKPYQLFYENNDGTIQIVQEAARVTMQSSGKFLILGDFNHKEILWDTFDLHGG